MATSNEQKKIRSDSVIEDKAVAILFDAEVNSALSAPDDTFLLAAGQLAAPLLRSNVVGPVVETIQPNSVNRLPIPNRVTILSPLLSLLPQQDSCSTYWLAKVFGKHESQGHVELELVQGQGLLLCHSFPQDVGVHNAEVDEVVGHTLVPLDGLGVDPVEGHLLVGIIDTAHALVVGAHHCRPADLDVLLACLVPPADLGGGLCTVGVGGHIHLLVVVPSDNKDTTVRQLVVHGPPPLLLELLLRLERTLQHTVGTQSAGRRDTHIPGKKE